MPNASISGLASGLDTATIISQLMQLEAVPQTSLKTRLTTEQSALSSMQSLNTKIAALAVKAGDLARTTAWAPVSATSSDAKLGVSTGAGASPGSFTVNVVHTAAAHQISFATRASLTDVVTNGSTLVRLDLLDGTTKDIETGDGTLSGLVNAVNTSNSGVRASTIKTADGSHRLQLTSTTTGISSHFALTNVDGSDLLGSTDPAYGGAVVKGRDAEITVGINNDTVTSNTNTFIEVMPGVTLTVAHDAVAGTAATVGITRDGKSIADSVQSMVDAINGALADMDALTGYNRASQKAGPLAGDAGMRSLRNDLLNAVYPSDGTSLASVGVQTDRSGKLVFDRPVFQAAYEADAAAVATRFTAANPDPGFAARVQTVAKTASDSVGGTITNAITGRSSGIKRLQDSIDNWDTRLELRRTTLTRQFTALETAMSQMQAQSSWLASQISSLPQMNS